MDEGVEAGPEKARTIIAEQQEDQDVRRYRQGCFGYLRCNSCFTRG